MQIGVIGLGNIGGASPRTSWPTATTVTVHDLDPALADAVTGASAAGDVGSVARASEITLLSLPTPEVVAAVATEWAAAAAPGSVLVDLSTNSPAMVRELGDRLAGLGPPSRRGAPDRRGYRRRAPDARVHDRAAPTNPWRGSGRCSSHSDVPRSTSGSWASATP